jgi:hypothetical protein
VIEGEDVRLAPIAREVAEALLGGRAPEGLDFADGYPSQFSLGEVVELVVYELA